MIESFVVLTVTREDVANTTSNEEKKKDFLDLADHQMQHIANEFENALVEFYWDTLKDVLEEM